ncbi:helix-turn-helix domain-containing protein [Desulfoscipio gibsoniae]
MKKDKIMQPVPRAWEDKPALRGNQKDYPPEVREQAIQLAIELKSSAKAAKRLGIDPSTVRSWVSQELATGESVDPAWSTGAIKEIEHKIDKILARVEPDKIDKAGLRDLIVAAGILLDKRAAMLPKAKNEAPCRLRIVWRGGQGAAEIESKE